MKMYDVITMNRLSFISFELLLVEKRYLLYASYIRNFKLEEK